VRTSHFDKKIALTSILAKPKAGERSSANRRSEPWLMAMPS
jgi:hypothetical protein